MTITLKALALAAVVAGAGPAGATVTEYTSQAAFDAAAPTATTFGFNGMGTTIFEPTPVSFNGLSFKSDVTTADMINGGGAFVAVVSAADTPTYGQDFLTYQNTDVGILGEIDSAGTSAIGFSYWSYVTPGAATVTLSTGDSFLISPSSTAAFVGFTSTAPITSVMISYPTGYSFDLISVSAIPSVPEPATWALMLIGFGAVGATVRRRRDPIRVSA